MLRDGVDEGYSTSFERERVERGRAEADEHCSFKGEGREGAEGG